MEINPVRGEDVEALVAQMMATPDDARAAGTRRVEAAEGSIDMKKAESKKGAALFDVARASPDW